MPERPAVSTDIVREKRLRPTDFIIIYNYFIRI